MRTVLPGPCPVCNTDIEFIYETQNIPYFSDIVIISALCPACGFRYTDTQVLSEREPCRWELAVRDPDDMSIRVVRSARGTVIIPELGARIDPGPACEGFVSNVEGVIDRFESVADGVIVCGDEEEREGAILFKEKVAMIRDGTLGITLVIEDPSGNSAIVSEKAIREPLNTDPDSC